LPDDRAAGGVGQGMEDQVQLGRSIYYHMVYYTKWYYDVKPHPLRTAYPVKGVVGRARIKPACYAATVAKSDRRLPRERRCAKTVPLVSQGRGVTVVAAETKSRMGEN
jgi:hypothetical protein